MTRSPSHLLLCVALLALLDGCNDAPSRGTPDLGSAPSTGDSSGPG